jgi:glyoxylase-like metal-dependent hydrolase (beta-lactamase superfamily II)
MKISQFFIRKNFLVILLLGIGLSTAGVRGNDALNLQRITDNLYQITGCGGNVAFLVSEEGVLVVDAGMFPYQGKEIVEKIRQVSDKKIKYLVYTHFHIDHVLGAQGFPSDVFIISHVKTQKYMEELAPSTIELLRSDHLPQQLKEAEQRVESLRNEESSDSVQALEELSLLQRQIKDMEALRVCYPQMTVEDDASIHLGGQEIRLINTGGAHTDGDLLVYFVDEKAVHMGDAFFKKRITHLHQDAGSNVSSWIDILEDIAGMNVDFILAGHDDVCSKADLLEFTEYLKDLRAEVGRFVKEEIPLEEIKKMIDLTKYRDWRGYDRHLNQNIEAVFEEIRVEMGME